MQDVQIGNLPQFGGLPHPHLPSPTVRNLYPTASLIHYAPHFALPPHHSPAFHQAYLNPALHPTIFAQPPQPSRQRQAPNVVSHSLNNILAQQGTTLEPVTNHHSDISVCACQLL